MSRIRCLELVFNLEKKRIQSKEDCVVLAFHCLLINEGLQCVGIGDDWPEPKAWTPTELLPDKWNENQDVYSLRYVSKDTTIRVLLKIVKSDHLLLVNAAKNADDVVSLDVPTAQFVSDNYSEYSTAYHDLGSLAELFTKEVLEKLNKEENPQSSKTGSQGAIYPVQPRVPNPNPPPRPEPDFEGEREPRNPFPSVGGADLDPLGRSRGGMFMDPSDFGIPGRPSLPNFGIGGPGGLPRGALPPGARFDPFMPPIFPGGRRRPPNPDFEPPDEDYI